jgi:predicted Zn-ribbon and HTH transcriptional regulator
MQSTTAQIVAGKASRRTLDTMLNDVLVYIESALEYDAQLRKTERPRCASCGATDNLTAGSAAFNPISYCPTCKADEEQR